MNLSTLLLFALGSLVMVASPGPDFFYVFTRGVAQGPRAGLLSALGISLGLLVHTTLAALGLTVLLQTSPLAFNIVKWVGALYLFFIGVQMLRSKSVLLSQPVPAQSGRSLVAQGVLTNVFNPKAALTFMAYLPQFVDSHAEFNAMLQIAVLGILLALIALLWFSLVGAFAGKVGAKLMRNNKVQIALRAGAAFIFMGLGVRLALQH